MKIYRFLDFTVAQRNYFLICSYFLNFDVFTKWQLRPFKNESIWRKGILTYWAAFFSVHNIKNDFICRFSSHLHNNSFYLHLSVEPLKYLVAIPQLWAFKELYVLQFNHNNCWIENKKHISWTRPKLVTGCIHEH